MMRRILIADAQAITFVIANSGHGTPNSNQAPAAYPEVLHAAK
jgi:hypothetical protein